MEEKETLLEKAREVPAVITQKQTLRSWLLAMLLGAFIGLAVIVPGVSGSTIAIIFGLYTGLLYAIGNIINDFRRCLRFLVPVGLGAVLGFGVGFLLIQRYFDAYMFEIVCLFVGFMLGALPAITQEIRGQRITPLRGTLLPVGILIPVAVALGSVLLTGGVPETEAFPDLSVWRFLLYLPLGAVVSVTQIVPGLSATAILMATGQFGPIINSLHLDYLLEHPLALGLYAAFGIGFVVGIVLISRGFTHLLARHKTTSFFMISGLSLGSILSMFLNADMWEIYRIWSAGEGTPLRSLLLGAALFAVGLVPSYFLTRFELKQSTEENKIIQKGEQQ